MKARQFPSEKNEPKSACPRADKSTITERPPTESLPGTFHQDSEPVSESASGRWTRSEHEAFLAGLKVYGREWKKVALCIPTRTSAQIRSHAQKYFAKLSKEQQQLLRLSGATQSPLSDINILSHPSNAILVQDVLDQSVSSLDTVNSIIADPTSVEAEVTQTMASLRERYKQLQYCLQKMNSSSRKLASKSVEFENFERNQNLAEFCADNSVKELTVGPATAALELEQKSLRKAAEARYEMKKHQCQAQKDDDESQESWVSLSLSFSPSNLDFQSK